MPEQFRDVISEPITLEYFHRRLAEGWVVAAVEWSRPASSGLASAADSKHEVPYGERIAEDCSHLVEDSREMDILALIYDGVISGLQPGPIAAGLNERSFRTRRGNAWSAATVFELMPRIIELSPRLQKRPDWPSHRQKLNLVG